MINLKKLLVVIIVLELVAVAIIFLYPALKPKDIITDKNPVNSSTVSLFGIIRDSGLEYTELANKEINYNSYRYQLTDLSPLNSFMEQGIDGYFIAQGTANVGSYLGRCVQINGEIDKTWQSTNKPEDTFSRGLIKINNIVDSNNCNFVPTAITEVGEKTTLVGTLSRINRPAPDIAYDYKLNLDEPQNIENAEGNLLTSLPIVPSNNENYLSIEEYILDGRQVSISGVVEWGYAESRVLIANEIKTNETQTTVKNYNVYFADLEKSSLPNQLYPVQRQTNRKDIATYLTEQLLVGPNENELNQGFSSALKLLDETGPTEEARAIVINSSSEARMYFDIKVEGNKLIVNFKRNAFMEGDLSGGRIKQQLEQTYKQLSNIKEVEIRFKGIKCWDDLSGMCKE